MGKIETVYLATVDPSDPTHLISTGEVQTIDDRDLADAQAMASSRLSSHYNSLISAGRAVTVEGTQKIYQIDDYSRGNMDAAGTLAAQVLANTPGANPWPTGFYWIASDNSTQAMTASDCFAFVQNVAAYYTALVLTNRLIKNAIAACASPGACDLIDVTAGWPPNP